MARTRATPANSASSPSELRGERGGQASPRGRSEGRPPTPRPDAGWTEMPGGLGPGPWIINWGKGTLVSSEGLSSGLHGVPISARGESSSPSLEGLWLEALAHLERERGSEGVGGWPGRPAGTPRVPGLPPGLSSCPLSPSPRLVPDSSGLCFHHHLQQEAAPEAPPM